MSQKGRAIWRGLKLGDIGEYRQRGQHFKKLSFSPWVIKIPWRGAICTTFQTWGKEPAPTTTTSVFCRAVVASGRPQRATKAHWEQTVFQTVSVASPRLVYHVIWTNQFYDRNRLKVLQEPLERYSSQSRTIRKIIVVMRVNSSKSYLS